MAFLEKSEDNLWDGVLTTMWALGIEIRSSGLAGGISMAQQICFIFFYHV